MPTTPLSIESVMVASKSMRWGGARRLFRTRGMRHSRGSIDQKRLLPHIGSGDRLTKELSVSVDGKSIENIGKRLLWGLICVCLSWLSGTSRRFCREDHSLRYAVTRRWLVIIGDGIYGSHLARPIRTVVLCPPMKSRARPDSAKPLSRSYAMNLWLEVENHMPHAAFGAK